MLINCFLKQVPARTDDYFPRRKKHDVYIIHYNAEGVKGGWRDDLKKIPGMWWGLYVLQKKYKIVQKT